LPIQKNARADNKEVWVRQVLL